MQETLTELKGDIDSSTVIGGDLYIPLEIMDEHIDSRSIRNRRLEQHSKLIRPKRHIQNTMPNRSRAHILLKCARNILQDRP